MNFSVPYECIKQQVDVRLTRTTVEIFFLAPASPPICDSMAALISTAQWRSICRRTTRPTCSGMVSVSSAGRNRLVSILLPWYGFSSRPQGGAAGLQVLYGPTETGGPLFLSAAGERLPESPLLYRFPQPQKRPKLPAEDVPAKLEESKAHKFTRAPATTRGRNEHAEQ